MWNDQIEGLSENVSKKFTVPTWTPFSPVLLVDTSDTLYKLNELEWSRRSTSNANLSFQTTFSLALPSWFLKVLMASIGSLSNDDGNCNENVTRKYIFISFVLLRDYFNSFNFYKNGELSRNQIGRSGLQVKKKKPPCVHVLNKTLNVVISRCCFAEDGKEMYQNVKLTCRAIVFAH